MVSPGPPKCPLIEPLLSLTNLCVFRDGVNGFRGLGFRGLGFRGLGA